MLTQEEQEHFAKLWTKAQSSVSQYIRAVIREPDVAGDVLQSTALVLLRKFHTYDPSRPFIAWALGAAKFQILGHQRDASRSLVSFDSDLLDRFTETWAETAPQLSAEGDAVQQCLKRVSGRAREVVQLRYVEGQNSSEIAEQLRLTASNVRVMLKRVRDQLRDCVEHQLQTEGGASRE